MEKKKYTIEISGSYYATSEKLLSEEEFALIEELCKELQTGYESLSIHEGWKLDLGF
jgi:hypothetical protein